jgi:hypothetical protein
MGRSAAPGSRQTSRHPVMGGTVTTPMGAATKLCLSRPGVWSHASWSHSAPLVGVCVLVILGLTHVTIASVTVFLHRHQAHHALDLHPARQPFLPRLAMADHWDHHARMGRYPS